MKILDVSQSQGIYTRDSKSTESCRRLNQAAGFMGSEIEVTISKEGWDAWREAEANSDLPSRFCLHFDRKYGIKIL